MPGNALSIDLEDWYHGCCSRPVPACFAGERRVRRNTELILALLAEFSVSATFFVLGSVAEEDPTLVPEIAAAGHEIASHGYSHGLLPRLGPERFRRELKRTAAVIEAQSGRPPAGFRAPQWSVAAAPWAFEILCEEGYLYDSSCSPLPFIGKRRGERLPHLVETAKGAILEFPPLVTPAPLCNLPTGGGWGLRFFPRSLVRRTVAGLNADGHPAVLFLHPRELDPDGPRLSLSPWRSFVSYGPRSSAAGTLRELLAAFPFTTLRELATTWQPA
ncbi:polysaccharide deacetylase family protein [Geomonas sp. Red32]|uniref:polysaccharide deacetylase family protein n=1 Tax=Geomonas sp. Red32 TaxID=2912856 RepID=UPI00202CEDB6|nr:polysaccharide deacetylase family protein [Geomonas sp. Red32]MCM0083079.1 polysaccharide deacetylase family protein [Geomonas sp. Red32]